MARFTVIGNHAVAGVAPGGIVDLDGGPNTDALIRSGHLRPLLTGGIITDGEPYIVGDSGSETVVFKAPATIKKVKPRKDDK